MRVLHVCKHEQSVLFQFLLFFFFTTDLFRFEKAELFNFTRKGKQQVTYGKSPFGHHLIIKQRIIQNSRIFDYKFVTCTSPKTLWNKHLFMRRYHNNIFHSIDCKFPLWFSDFFGRCLNVSAQSIITVVLGHFSWNLRALLPSVNPLVASVLSRWAFQLENVTRNWKCWKHDFQKF